MATDPSHEVPELDPFEGTRYRRVRLLGAGTAGEVFLVEHRALGTHFVAKVLHRWLVQGKAGQRFCREAKALGSLQAEPNIVRVFGFESTADGRPFIVLEYLRGYTLGEALAAGHSPSVEVALFLTCELLSALAAAHELEIVHRDINPENLLLSEQSDGSIVLKVVDFGIARLLCEADPSAPAVATLLTTTGSVLGNPRFNSPETALGQRSDAAADLYATAIVLYLMLAGRTPFAHLDESQVSLGLHGFEDPQPPSLFSTQAIPRELDALLLRAIQRDPEGRFQTANEFLKALGPILDDRLGASRTRSANSPPSMLNVGNSSAPKPEEDARANGRDDSDGARETSEPGQGGDRRVVHGERAGAGIAERDDARAARPLTGWTILLAGAFLLAAAITAGGAFSVIVLARRMIVAW